MKKWILFFIAVGIVIVSCKKTKDCTVLPPTKVASSTEITNIQNFLASNGITNATQLPSGMYYVLNQGGGESPNLCSNITLTYKGNVFGVVKAFDSTNTGATATFPLNNLIAGWQLVLPLVKSGGSVTLFIPPSLGYGASSPSPSLPANSYLKFDINLISVN